MISHCKPFHLVACTPIPVRIRIPALTTTKLHPTFRFQPHRHRFAPVKHRQVTPPPTPSPVSESSHKRYEVDAPSRQGY
ncbi:hypothetical protein HK102_001105 [Quaeritorhiza haematococci]|nr:hypothetical protein HK102_001105 [Quaeritorhiza haematococci]